ncbi:30S ribosomal protein S3 [Candidatus Wolfebacteria bacterium CG18_big_fil_WC_8_21_14_2_50_39_7]|uniref:Small ribosomal subunit protein uS3 n=5 Tax=Candidatus Wolfeibacteriota TaxID=1752735 RepID=A0A2M8D802_9BACT|nr:30S ribosomal protein S3 [Parcubacteria group bacterium]NCO89406.1 30S ribosomal protein S3 [Candidatus Wolfebacteria bacterium]OIO65478.1 MAG: 30S ribosomal protein S3 [Candidatus Wolfebacteria bacterium CG1_02_39_135]PIP91957.1 MAG: 30S ribosomal protein S3 [Candidatus Wolfebacteria bacterium CG18_big_fil_WC_8_21_14_2_50_39_7]PIU98744.1 MAG: 30S ribosomal protein S3 [Candidatus Wolfebacteria bacterium CG03_land_8_20_14_0_80_39_317]PJB83257.1 MAG: 30S ribosomal protein S3 [Candidatus Wolfe
MGQKIRPNSFRTGITKGWLTNWFSKKSNFKTLLEEDILIRKIIKEKIGNAGIDKISIEKTGNNYKIFIKASRPGLIIGRGGKGVEELTKFLENNLKKLRKEKGFLEPISLSLNIEELKRQEVSANVIAQNIAWDLEKRMPYRRTIKKCLDQMLQNKEVQGAKIMVKGRLNGAEIARDQHLEKGKLPLQTLRANIDYGTATAFTTYGTIGIKIWIYKGEIFE